MPRVKMAAGCHPHNAKSWNGALEERLVRWLRAPGVTALGEIGLDYHYDFSPVEDQKRAFRAQLRLAHTAGLPVVLHIREAYDDALEIMRDEGFPPAGVLLHCFTADADTLAPWLEAGCSVSFGGALTFGNSDDIRAAAATVPVEQLLLETDAPYMAPKPLRGEKCEPAQIMFTAARMLEVRGIEDDTARRDFLAQTRANAIALFGRTSTAWQRGASQS